jgi:ectoine hydroxylase-related dioxygenase (phytanoyl-CoA dioxygenase family)
MNAEKLQELNAQGYVVIPNVLSSEQCDHYVSETWKQLENLGTGIQRESPETWHDQNWPDNDHGIIHQYNAAHWQHVWDLRCEPKIIDIFAKLWKTRKLLVSFDGINVTRPPKYNSNQSSKSWYHTDQSFYKEGRHCVQGFINLDHSETNDATFSCLSGSHHFHKELGQNFDIEVDNDHYELRPKEIRWLCNEKKCLPVRVDIPKGSFLLFDSRTIHCNFPSKKKSSNRFRHVAYICMTPADWIDSKNLSKKKRAFTDMRTTTHWPHEVTLFRKEPFDKTKGYDRFHCWSTKPKLSKIANQLAGLIPYKD